MVKVRNAIILAAGRGSRLQELTDKTPKPLLLYHGKPIIEYLIEYLLALKIKDIYVVTGYLGEQFDYLKDKVKLIHNHDWQEGNNITSIAAALPVLGNSLIINGDVIMTENVLQTSYPSSLTYVEKNAYVDEWIVNVDHDDNIKSFDKEGKNKTGYYQREITFITNEIATQLEKEISSFDRQEYQEYLMLHIAHKYQVPFKIKIIKSGIVFDLDYKDEYLKHAKKKA